MIGMKHKKSTSAWNPTIVTHFWFQIKFIYYTKRIKYLIGKWHAVIVKALHIEVKYWILINFLFIIGNWTFHVARCTTKTKIKRKVHQKMFLKSMYMKVSYWIIFSFNWIMKNSKEIMNFWWNL